MLQTQSDPSPSLKNSTSAPHASEEPLLRRNRRLRRACASAAAAPASASARTASANAACAGAAPTDAHREEDQRIRGMAAFRRSASAEASTLVGAHIRTCARKRERPRMRTHPRACAKVRKSSPRIPSRVAAQLACASACARDASAAMRICSLASFSCGRPQQGVTRLDWSSHWQQKTHMLAAHEEHTCRTRATHLPPCGLMKTTAGVYGP
eukprot:3438036-Pleurochrysis_carterae.AAC.1